MTIEEDARAVWDYHHVNDTQEDVIHIMVGDLQRLLVYGRRGWSIPQVVPPGVMAAFHRLREAGYTKRLLPEAE